jgi:hypothetical protein
MNILAMYRTEHKLFYVILEQIAVKEEYAFDLS